MSDYGTHTYNGIARNNVDAILKGLTTHGSIVTGNNPWTIDTKKHGVLLRGEWNEATSTLTITVINADWYVPRKAIWDNIDTLMHDIHTSG